MTLCVISFLVHIMETQCIILYILHGHVCVMQSVFVSYSTAPYATLLDHVRDMFLAPQIEYSAFLPVSTKLIFLACIR